MPYEEYAYPLVLYEILRIVLIECMVRMHKGHLEDPGEVPGGDERAQLAVGMDYVRLPAPDIGKEGLREDRTDPCAGIEPLAVVRRYVVDAILVIRTAILRERQYPDIMAMGNQSFLQIQYGYDDSVYGLRAKI